MYILILLSTLFSLGTTSDLGTLLSPNFKLHVGHTDEAGQPFYREVRDFDQSRLQAKRDNHEFLSRNSLSHAGDLKMDFLPTNRTLTYDNSSPLSGVSNVVEIVIVVDKEFGDIFQHDYYRIVDYLAVYFWDINMRYKTLSEDITWVVNGLLIMDSPAAQPFIEQARASDGRAEFGRILNLYKNWVYEQRGWLVRHDLAPLITNARLEWGGGLAWMNAACGVNDRDKADYGTAVWNDDGKFGSVTVAAHELGHNMGAPHDDDPSVNCPDMGFIMGGGNDERKFFFSKCSDRKISEFVRSDQAACLRRTDGYATTPMDPKFSTPKAPSMADMCKLKLSDSNAWIEDQDTRNCKTLRCLKKDEGGTTWIWTLGNDMDNVLCNGNSGDRCFRGVCRKVGKQLKNAGTGNCLQAPDHFGFMVEGKMGKCVEAKDLTPLESVVSKDESNGKYLSTPFLNDDNKESGDRCFWTGNADGNTIWTDRCNTGNPWHGWEFRNVNGGFLLVHKVTGRCAKGGSIGANVPTYNCNSGDNSMVWNYV